MAVEGHYNIRVNEGGVVPDKGFGDIGHDAGVIAGQALCSENLYIKSGPGAFRGKSQGQQEAPGVKGQRKIGRKEDKKLSNPLGEVAMGQTWSFPFWSVQNSHQDITIMIIQNTDFNKK